MTDEERELRDRFAALRSEELRRVPPFARPWQREWYVIPYQLVAAAALMLVLSLAVVLAVRSRRPAFSAADRAAARSIAAWHPPTEFLLHTPGHELLAGTPVIPDIPKGALR